MTGVIKRGKLIRGDLARFDGRNKTYSRKDASGGTVTGLVTDNSVDVLQVFGSGTSYTAATITQAINYIGTEQATILIAPGDWAITTSITIPSNISVLIPAGVDLQVSMSVTLTFSGPVYSDQETFYSGAGTVVISADSVVGGQAWIATTAGESAASVTPSSTFYVPGDRAPGDIRRYGVTSGSSAAAVANAVQDALASHGYAFIPNDTWAWDPVLFTGEKQRIVGGGPATILSHSSTGDMIDFDGYNMCRLENVYLFSATAARGVRIGPNSGVTRYAHRWALKDVSILGSSGGVYNAGTIAGFTTAGIELITPYYGTITGGDIAYCTRGIYAYNGANAASLHAVTFRQNVRALHLLDTTSNSDGFSMHGGSIESAEASTIAGIDIEGFDSLSVHGTRMEISGGSAVHIRARAGAGAASRLFFYGVELEGTDDAYTFGSGSGSSNVTSVGIYGGRSAGAITVNSDVDDFQIIAPPNAHGGTFTDNGLGSTVMTDPVNSKWYIKNGANKVWSLLAGGSTTRESLGTNTKSLSWTDAVDAIKWVRVDIGGGTFMGARVENGYYRWTSPTNGKDYVKATAPTAHDDGTVVGTQT